MRVDSTVLYDRLKARGYGEKKLQENLDSEIMGVLSEEARDGFDKECVVELKSDAESDLEGNCSRVEEWVRRWMKEKGGIADGDNVRETER